MDIREVVWKFRDEIEENWGLNGWDMVYSMSDEDMRDWVLMNLFEGDELDMENSCKLK